MLCYVVISWQSKPMLPISNWRDHSSWVVDSSRSDRGFTFAVVHQAHHWHWSQCCTHTANCIGLSWCHGCPALDHNGFLHDQRVFASQRMVMLNFSHCPFPSFGKVWRVVAYCSWQMTQFTFSDLKVVNMDNWRQCWCVFKHRLQIAPMLRQLSYFIVHYVNCFISQ